MSCCETAKSVANNFGEGMRGVAVVSTFKCGDLGSTVVEGIPRLVVMLLLLLPALACAGAAGKVPTAGRARGELPVELRRRCGAVVGEGKPVAGNEFDRERISDAKRKFSKDFAKGTYALDSRRTDSAQ